MGWIGNLIEVLKGAESLDFVHTDSLLLNNNGQLEQFPSEPLEEDKCYVQLFVESIWLPMARKITGVYHGVVHAYSALDRQGDKKSQIAFVSTPSELAKVDPRSIRKIVTKSLQALGPIPWRGGTLDLEIGLFSVKSYDLTTPWLSMVTQLSESAGVSFVTQSAPFVPFIRKGVELVTGADGDSALEIGLDTSIENPSTGYYALVAADSSKIDKKKLSLAAGDKRLLLNGETLRECPWLVYRIGKVTKRSDFGTIPELKEAWSSVLTAIKSRRRSDAQDALTVFRITAITSPDLIPTDAEHLTEKAKMLMTQAFKDVMQNKSASDIALPSFESLVATIDEPGAP